MEKKKKLGKRKWDGLLCGAGLVLDAAIWGNMPLDIQLKLLKHLPLPALLRFQIVCKAWYEAIRNLNEVTAHGDCYIALVMKTGCRAVRVYSSLDEGTLQLQLPRWAVIQTLVCTTGDGLLYFAQQENSSVYNVITRKRSELPPAPLPKGCTRLAHVVGRGDRDGEFAIIRVVCHKNRRLMLVYQSGRGAWETFQLQLPPGEEFSMSLISECASHAATHGSILYFLTVNLWTREMSVRSIDYKRNIEGTSTRVLSLARIASSYLMYQHEDCLLPPWLPCGRPFTGNIALAGGKLFLACVRACDPANPELCTVDLLVCDKQRREWDFVSEMPLTQGFVPWQPREDHFVQLRSRGDMLVICNYIGFFACLYNTSTKVWSLLDGGGTDIVHTSPLKLSMRFK